mgnify:FL=1
MTREAREMDGAHSRIFNRCSSRLNCGTGVRLGEESAVGTAWIPPPEYTIQSRAGWIRRDGLTPRWRFELELRVICYML